MQNHKRAGMVYQNKKKLGKEGIKRPSIWEGTCFARTTYKENILVSTSQML
jgi:hypothetical protein